MENRSFVTEDTLVLVIVSYILSAFDSRYILYKNAWPELKDGEYDRKIVVDMITNMWTKIRFWELCT